MTFRVVPRVTSSGNEVRTYTVCQTLILFILSNLAASNLEYTQVEAAQRRLKVCPKPAPPPVSVAGLGLMDAHTSQHISQCTEWRPRVSPRCIACLSECICLKHLRHYCTQRPERLRNHQRALSRARRLKSRPTHFREKSGQHLATHRIIDGNDAC